MRRRAALLLLLPLTLGGLPALADSEGSATAVVDATPVQTVQGSVAAPTRFTNPEQGYPGLGRRLYLAHAGTNGSTYSLFDVDPKSWGGAFEISEVSDATGEADMDVYFYSDLGTVGGVLASDPGQPTSTAEYGARGAGGETGFIPPGTTKALVFTYNGVGSTFTYQAFAAPRIAIGNGDLDVTVPDGAFVAWVNDTDDYAYVHRGVAPMPFSSGTGPASGLRKGEEFLFQVTRTGSFAYTAGTSTTSRAGTLTVVAGPGAGTPAA